MSTIAPRFDLTHLVSRHLIGLFASSQATGAVMLHAGWVFMLLMGLLPEAGGASQSATEPLGRGLLRALTWIGALERDGGNYHGDLGTVVRALAALTPVIYFGRLLIDWLRRGRPAWSMARKALLSMAVAACGYATALVLLPDDARSALWVMVAVAVVLTGVATFWALLARKACDAVLRNWGLLPD